MIKTLVVTGLNKATSCNWVFNKDLNIITGKNGSGKTTLLKLLWYLISANIERIFLEVEFKTIELETTSYKISIKLGKNKKPGTPSAYTISYNSKEAHISIPHFSSTDSKIKPNHTHIIDKINREIADLNQSSVYFPTFRRIEGGVSLRVVAGVGDSWKHEKVSSVDRSLAELSDAISVFDHKFVTSISTHDIVQLLTSRYADISEQTNNINSNLSRNIIDTINNYTNISDETQKINADDVLVNIAEQVDQVSIQNNELLKPFTVLSDLVKNIIKDKSISVNENMIIGDTTHTVSSDKLSAGEKQMLSFLCYNAFYKNSPIFIDEPELSLHVDWQRILFPILLQQETKNQFIIATHSPFIYSKYPDKELPLNTDKGE